jgi:hypothetical protein
VEITRVITIRDRMKPKPSIRLPLVRKAWHSGSIGAGHPSAADPAIVWLPNNKLVQVTVSIEAQDIYSGVASVNLTSITSNEQTSPSDIECGLRNNGHSIERVWPSHVRFKVYIFSENCFWGSFWGNDQGDRAHRWQR